MSGPGDNFMSLQFQSHLLGNNKTAGSTFIPFDSEITLQHSSTNAFLHSHAHNYPLRYEDGRISSKGQQVLGYSTSDFNSGWVIESVDPALHPDSFDLSGIKR
jgi:dolichyl-phosphate-mannose-protein mannosyltransferase